MRILLDANLGLRVQEHLTARGHDVIRVGQSLPPGSTDQQVAALAIEQSRHIITEDRGLWFEMRTAQIVFPHALITLRCGPGADEQIAALEFLLAAHPTWLDHFHYIVRPSEIRIGRL